MTPFLQQLAQEIVAEFPRDPGKLCVVLPNRRAGLYLRKYLAEAYGRTSWAPTTLSIEDFILSLTGSQVLDTPGLLFEFYAVHREIHGENAQEFEIFNDWAPLLLSDFDEIDHYLVDPEKIFTYLSEARALSVWNLDQEPLTGHEEGYIRFYRSFLEYYRRLAARLEKGGALYQGLAYRLAAERIAGAESHLPWERIYFAGLNALSSAEEVVISHLVDSGKARLFWDADRYYIETPGQEAGEFIRKYLSRWPTDPVKWMGEDLLKGEKNIRIYGIPMSMGQARKAADILRGLKSGDHTPDRTAVVLADEKLLAPVLYALPAETGPVNVTMGYPLRQTPMYQFAEHLFSMHANAEKFARLDPERGRLFYLKDVIRVLGHPYIRHNVHGLNENAENLRSTLLTGNRVFLSTSEIMDRIPLSDNRFLTLLRLVTMPWDNPGQALGMTIDILDTLRAGWTDDEGKLPEERELDMEYLFHFAQIITRCKELFGKYSFAASIRTLKKVVLQIADSVRLPFSGEPLQGVQVMGVLETRAIDFENLIVISVNEGVIPAGRSSNSFIPIDIKLEFGLPTYRQKDAVFAYHFYRMLQKAKNIFLLYDTEGDQMKGGEKSRFILQIAHEMKKRNPGITLTDELLSPEPPDPGPFREIRVPKSPLVAKKLAEKALTGFSPTALTSFILCPLQFYYKEILGLTEAETVEENILAQTIGTVVHDVFHQVYVPWKGQRLSPAGLRERAAMTDQFLDASFSKHYRHGDLRHGKNLLVYKASALLIRQFIETEAEILEELESEGKGLTILALEQTLETWLGDIPGAPEKVRIKGKADRIDLMGNTIRVIDYKTGMVKKEELDFKDWEEPGSDTRKSKALQLLVYAWLFGSMNQDKGYRVETGNISLRKISEYFMPVRPPGSEGFDETSAKNTEGIIRSIIGRIFDPTEPFIQTEQQENCTYCPFQSICTR